MSHTIAILIVLFALAVISYFGWKDANSFNQKFPPMSDEEFMAALPPGTSRRVALGVRRIVSEQLNIPYLQIHPSSRFIEDLKCD